jgi:hypothetical protein
LRRAFRPPVEPGPGDPYEGDARLAASDPCETPELVSHAGSQRSKSIGQISGVTG